MLMGKSAGAVSGGTIASLMGAMFDETPEELRLSADPYALNPPNAHRYGISAHEKRLADSFSCTPSWGHVHDCGEYPCYGHHGSFMLPTA